jgi:hypothetical protein
MKRAANTTIEIPIVMLTNMVSMVVLRVDPFHTIVLSITGSFLRQINQTKMSSRENVERRLRFKSNLKALIQINSLIWNPSKR